MSAGGVTLVSFTGSDEDRAARRLLACAAMFPDWEAVLISTRAPAFLLPPRVRQVRIPAMDYLGNSRFSVEALHAHIHTAHCLTIQPDGYITHPHLWDEEFLRYDYIGAPWPPGVFGRATSRVGNSGFCLRSKAWLEAGVEAGYADQGDDVFMCHLARHWYVAKGLRIAPIDVAIRFSLELPIPEFPHWRREDSFGGHAL